MEDKLIVKNIKYKKECGLEMFIDKYGGYIRAILRSKLYNLSLCEDECFDDILMAIWNNINSFDESKGSFKNWVISVSRYKIIDYNRAFLRSNKNIESIDDEGTKHILKDESARTDKRILERELKKEIDDLLSNLKDSDKEIFIKHYLEERSVPSISNDIGIKTEVIYNRLSRGRIKLKKILAHSKLF